MLVSKPNLKTLSSLMTFLLLNFGIMLYVYFDSGSLAAMPIYKIILVGLLAIVGILIIIKMVGAYKVVTVDKQKIHVKYPLKFTQLKTNLKALDYWQESIIKTNRSLFKEIKMHFNTNKTIKITYQENTNYDKLRAYLQKHAAKKLKSNKN